MIREDDWNNLSEKKHILQMFINNNLENFEKENHWGSLKL